MRTYSLKGKEIDKGWQVIDATGQPLGRLASRVAGLLMGKDKPTYARHLDMGDFVVVVNAERVRITGNKLADKVYYRHTGYMGGLKETTLADLMARRPARVIELAVRGMLPRNRLGRAQLRHLKVYAGPDHPHEAQVNASRKRRPAAAALAPIAPETEKSS
ncbi:MAG: 50S ribosomal protein L13 [Chloroflexi bacterium]|nr:50S ribosomal protein L13 [Chloroflexota bacterium]